MPYRIKLEKFEGPLDLLLQLIEAEELPITEVSLANVTEQYVNHLRSIEEKNPEELADFLLIAAKLLLIKSRILLPALDLGVDEDGMSLEEQLKLYREYAAASREVGKMIGKHRFAWGRERSPIQQGVFTPPPNLTMEKLASVFWDVIRALEPVLELPKAAMERTVSIKEKIDELKSLVLNRVELSFATMVRGAKNKTEVIVSFLALLELIKQKIVLVSQGDLFEDIHVTRV